MLRVTTNGVLKNYRTNLTKSSHTLDQARNTVLTQRNFNTYAEDPGAATQAFKLRRSWWRTQSQYTNSQTVVNKFESAYSSLQGVADALYNTNKSASSVLDSSIAGGSDATASGRAPLGKQLAEAAKGVIQSMNAKYGDSFIFAGADGLNVPFTWSDDGELCYRGINVNCEPGSEDYEKLQALSKDATYIDLGMGFQEDGKGNFITSSGFNSALNGLDFLGFGMDEEGLPNNLVSVVKDMGDILSRCDQDSGDWASDEDKTRYEQLQKKLDAGYDKLTEARTEQSASVSFLNTTQDQLKDTSYTLNEQIMSVEQCKLPDAITAFIWAQYSYNAALKVGNSILSQSLMDYMN